MIGFIIGMFVGAAPAFLIFYLFFSAKDKEPKPLEKKLVYIASPYRGARKRNIRKAIKYTKSAINENIVPITPHLFYSAVLDDTDPEQRETGMAMGIALLRHCDELWAFGEPSEGMKMEIAAAESLQIPVTYYSEAGGRKDITQ